MLRLKFRYLRKKISIGMPPFTARKILSKSYIPYPRGRANKEYHLLEKFQSVSKNSRYPSAASLLVSTNERSGVP